MNINLTVYEDGKMEGTVWILFMVRYCIRCMNANTGVKANIGHCKVTVGSSLFQSLSLQSLWLQSLWLQSHSIKCR